MVGGQAIDLAAADGHADADAGAGGHARAQDRRADPRRRASPARSWPARRPRSIAAIDAYARELGLAFQIVDDVLDVEGSNAELGKTAGKDAAAGKPTYPALYGVDGRATACRRVPRPRDGRARRRAACDGRLADDRATGASRGELRGRR